MNDNFDFAHLDFVAVETMEYDGHLDGEKQTKKTPETFEGLFIYVMHL